MGSETVASTPPPPSFTFWGADKKKRVTLHPDGRIELGEGVTLDDATLAFWQGVEAAGFERLNAELESLRASLTRVEGAWCKIASFTEMHWQGAGAEVGGDWLFDEIVRRAHEGSRAEDRVEELEAALTRVEEERDEAKSRALEWFRVAQRATPVTAEDIAWAEKTVQTLGLSRADGETGK